MKKKNDWKHTKWGIILQNILAAVIIAILLIVILIICLRNYTHHDEEIVVPNITGMYIEEAEVVISSLGLRLQVVDSTYSNKTALGTLVEQKPIAASKVKQGRTIYAIQNARFRRPVVMPELRDMSLRQSEATLQTLGLHVDSIVYEPSAYKNILLDVRKDGIPLSSGTRLQEGDSVTLVVGKGQGTSEVTVPSVIGKSLTDARSWLLGNMLTVGVVEYDIEPTEETKDLYVVYSQSPESGTTIVEGTSVNLKLSTDIEKTVTADNEVDEEEFF